MGSWDYGRAIPFLGIFVSNIWYWFFAVFSTHTPTKRPVTKRPVTKRPVTKRPVTKGPDYQTSRLPNVQFTKRPVTKHPVTGRPY